MTTKPHLRLVVLNQARGRPHMNLAVALGAVMMLVALHLSPGSAQAQMSAPVARYEGHWDIQPNGDVKVVRTYKLSMQLYKLWKQNDLHMLEARNFAGERASVEVAAQKADWDDLNQTLTLTMTVLGLCENMADHWEARILPFLEFSNLDENRRIAYFHYSTQGEAGRMEGQDMIILPDNCTKPAWDKSRKVVTYAMPAWAAPRPQAGLAANAGWWLAAVGCVVAGVSLWLISLLVKPVAKPDPNAEVSV